MQPHSTQIQVFPSPLGPLGGVGGDAPRPLLAGARGGAIAPSQPPYSEKTSQNEPPQNPSQPQYSSHRATQTGAPGMPIPHNRTVIETTAAPAPVGPYNQAIAAQGSLVFTAGQIALDPATGQIVGNGDVAAETEQVLKNLAAVLAAANTGTKIAGGLVCEVASLSGEEQLQFMRDLVSGVDNSLTRAYGVLSSNNKLAFWYQLAEWMGSGEIIPIPEDYQLSAPATAIVNKVVALGFNQQIAVLRLILGKMGINPF